MISSCIRANVPQTVWRHFWAHRGLFFAVVWVLQTFQYVSFAHAQQSIFDREKQKWMDRDGKLLDFLDKSAWNYFAVFAKGEEEARYDVIQKGINDLLNDESWHSGNYAGALMGVQVYYCFGDKLRATEKQKLGNSLQDLITDQYYFGNTLANTGINTMTVRYVLSQHDPAKQVKYNVPDNLYGPPNFTYEGRTYTRGRTYSSYELARDYLYYWFEVLLEGGYLQGELFSEHYGIHFVNSLVTLTDSRMVKDPEMRRRAKLVTDFFQLEHVVNTNDYHMAGPLGRSYMQLHLDGTRHLLYWDCYWGKMYPTHYGHPDGPYILQYRITPVMEDIGRYDDEPADYWHLVKSSVQGERNIFIAKDYTLGSNPNDGNWLLEIHSNDPGPFPQARPGMLFRLWMNEYDDDLNPAACTGECYSQMGMHAHQYKNALLVNVGNTRLYEALYTNQWDRVEGDSRKSWRFSQEGKVAVAIRQTAASSALEVARIGIDYGSFEEFKNAVLTRAKLDGPVFVTSKGDRIEARYNTASSRTETYVNGQRYWQGSTPRLEVTTNRGEKVVEWKNRVMTVRKHGRVGIYDFNRWTYSETDDGTIIDRDPPRVPAGFKIGQ
ncbi:MAG: hypothetical protein ALAOOOJD_04323 [bacterium]|nr:hypothetical protein [bacterium]